MALLNTQLIAERALELGLSPIDLARALGTSTVAIRSLEQGRNHDKLTLHKTKLLADVLGLPLHTLFTKPEPVEHDATNIELKTEAALSLVGRRVDVEDLATALECTLQQAHDALRALRARRRAAGVNVSHNGGSWGLVANRGMLAAREVEKLERAHVTRSRINVSEAALLKKVIDHSHGLRPDALSNAQKPILARLIRLGWVIKSDNRYHATDDVRVSLGLAPRLDEADTLSPDPAERRDADRD